MKQLMALMAVLLILVFFAIPATATGPPTAVQLNFHSELLDATSGDQLTTGIHPIAANLDNATVQTFSSDIEITCADSSLRLPEFYTSPACVLIENGKIMVNPNIEVTPMTANNGLSAITTENWPAPMGRSPGLLA